MKWIKVALLVWLIALAGSCGSGASNNHGNNNSPSLTPGPWEISINGSTLIDANLLMCQSGCRTVSTSNPPYLMGAAPGTGQEYQGLSPSNEAQALTLSGTIQGSSIALDFSETNCPCGTWDWHLVGAISADGNGISGTATFNGNSAGATAFSGVALGTNPNSSYSGSFALFDVNGTQLGTDTAQLALVLGSAANGYGTSATLMLSGTDSGVYALSGSQDGKTLLLSGTINGQSVSLVGYYDSTGSYTGTPGSLLVFEMQDPPMLDSGWYGISGVLAAN